MVGAVLDHVIGDLATQNDWAEGSAQKVLLHGLSGAIQAGIAGGSLAAGIAAGAVNEKLIPLMTDYLRGQGVSESVQDAQGNTVLNPQFAELLKIGSTLVGAAAGAVAGSGAGSGAGNVALGASVGLTGTTYNFLLHNKLKDEEGELLRLRKQKESGQCDTGCNSRIQELEALDKFRDEQLAPLIDACEKSGRNNCKGEIIARQFAAANGFGAESMKRESNPGTQGSPFSFNNCPASDHGGCSYGPLQIAADTGMMQGFMDSLRKNPAPEAQSFYQELQAAGGVTASQNKDPGFLQTWMKLTAKDPQFVQYQIDALVNQNLYPVVQELQKVGMDFNTLSTTQKEALFSAAVQHGSGVQAKTKGADNVLERAISVAQTDTQAPSFPTYTRQDLVYGQVEDQMRAAEESKAKLISQQRDLISQQLQLERQKSDLLQQGLGVGAGQLQRIQDQVNALDQKIGGITNQVTTVTGKVNTQDQYIREAGQYLKEQAKEALGNGEQFIRDFYKARTEMYPSEAKRYRLEMESLLRQYRQEQIKGTGQ